MAKKSTTKKQKTSTKSDKTVPVRFGKNLLETRLQSRRENKDKSRQKHTRLSGSFRLFADSTSFLRQHWKIFGSITLIYAVLSIVLVGVRSSGLNVGELRNETGLGLTLLSLMTGSGNPGTESATAYQTMVFLVISLATIWALRQLMAGQKIGIRDAFYKGTYPLVPVVLVLIVIGIQVIPLMLGGFLFAVMFPGGVAVGFFEKAIWGSIIFLLVVLSLYMFCSSLFAFYIATLPDMRPIAALRSARKLVRFRRWTIMRKLLFLPLALLIIGAALTLPFIWIWPAGAQWIFLLLSMAGLIFVHTYLYSLYRELL